MTNRRTFLKAVTTVGTSTVVGPWVLRHARAADEILIAELHDGEGLTFEQIYFHFLRHGLRTRTGNEWSLSRIKRVYAARAQLADAGSP